MKGHCNRVAVAAALMFAAACFGTPDDRGTGDASGDTDVRADDAHAADDGNSGDVSDVSRDVVADLGATNDDDIREEDVTDEDASDDDAPDADSGTSGRADAPVEPVLACNAHPSSCDLPLDRILFAGTHNAMSARADGFFAPNQEYGIAQQLDEGIRALLIDAYRYRDDFYLCHGGCEIGATLASDALGEVAAFLETRPSEVILVIIENHISPAEAVEMLVAAGLDRWAITPPDGAWPTLGELVEADTRILLTLESGAADVPWLPNAWSVFHDTPYSFSSTDAFTCDGNRGRTGEGLYLVNHWVQDPISYPELAAQANTREELEARLEACSAVDQPNILAVDFYDVGDVVEVVNLYNAAL